MISERLENSCVNSNKLKSIFNTDADNNWKDNLVDVMIDI